MISSGLSWTALDQSRAQRRWLFCALALCGLLASVFLARLLFDPTAGLGIASLAAATAAVIAARTLGRPGRLFEVKIDRDGTIWRRPVDSANDETRSMPAVVSRQLVTFTGGAEPIVIWHDNVSADRFRRLSAHARWHVERSGQDADRERAGTVPSA